MNERAKRKIWFDRNEQAEELEAEGKHEEAISLYEQNVAENCDVAYTYERLAALYAGREQYSDEAAALSKALEIEKRRGPSDQVIRLQKRIEQSRLAESRSRKSGTGSRRVESEEPLLRSSAPSAKKSKGCMTVLLLLFAVASSFFI